MTTDTTNTTDPGGSPLDGGVRPRAWTLQSELDAKETICHAHLWFSDPQNTAWAPLYDQAAIDALAAERDGLMQTLRDEIDENLRLRELGGALPDENITAMTERLIRERNALRAQLAVAARGLKHCAGWNINDDKRNALMAVVIESEAMLAPGPNFNSAAPPVA
jgi:hypothetical protein